ncbi:MAG: thiamine-phosphate diphosphorylase [Betaproteobacteria bacterium]|nr:thiamine-phosphate diphosphorylase [Betaproteobacteria bacterium]
MQPIKGLYAVTPDTADTAGLVARVEIMLAAGAGLLQYRNKTADDATRGKQALALAQLCRRHGTTFIINDQVELAAAVDADGVHVGADDMALTTARARLGRDKIIGVSCYADLARARDAAAGGADYLAFGSFFASSVKPQAVRAPVSLLAAARELGLPVVAIGGITLANAGELIRAGADAVAVISALFSAPDIRATTQAFGRMFAMQSA